LPNSSENGQETNHLAAAVPCPGRLRFAANHGTVASQREQDSAEEAADAGRDPQGGPRQAAPRGNRRPRQAAPRGALRRRVLLPSLFCLDRSYPSSASRYRCIRRSSICPFMSARSDVACRFHSFSSQAMSDVTPRRPRSSLLRPMPRLLALSRAIAALRSTPYPAVTVSWGLTIQDSHIVHISCQNYSHNESGPASLG
jgi:hypothetical protein